MSASVQRIVRVGNDVDRNDHAYDKEDYLGKNHEKQLRNMSD